MCDEFDLESVDKRIRTRIVCDCVLFTPLTKSPEMSQLLLHCYFGCSFCEIQRLLHQNQIYHVHVEQLQILLLKKMERERDPCSPILEKLKITGKYQSRGIQSSLRMNSTIFIFILIRDEQHNWINMTPPYPQRNYWIIPCPHINHHKYHLFNKTTFSVFWSFLSTK